MRQILLLLIAWTSAACAQRFSERIDTVRMNLDIPLGDVRYIMDNCITEYRGMICLITGDSCNTQSLVMLDKHYKLVRRIEVPRRTSDGSLVTAKTMFVRNDSLLIVWHKGNDDDVFCDYSAPTRYLNTTDWTLKTCVASASMFYCSKQYDVFHVDGGEWESWTTFISRQDGTTHLFRGWVSCLLPIGRKLYAINRDNIFRIDNPLGAPIVSTNNFMLYDQMKYDRMKTMYHVHNDYAQQGYHRMGSSWILDDDKDKALQIRQHNPFTYLLTGFVRNNKMYLIVHDGETIRLTTYREGKLKALQDVVDGCGAWYVSGNDRATLPSRAEISLGEYESHNAVFISVSGRKIRIVYFVVES